MELTAEQIRAIQDALRKSGQASVREAQWERKQPMGRLTTSLPRLFTREEVLTVLRATKAVVAIPRCEADAANHRLLEDLIRVFERIE